VDNDSRVAPLPRRGVAGGLGLAAATRGVPGLVRSAHAAAGPIRIGTLTDLDGPALTGTGMPTVHAAQMVIEDFWSDRVLRAMYMTLVKSPRWPATCSPSPAASRRRRPGARCRRAPARPSGAADER